jgi:hypothetical protein
MFIYGALSSEPRVLKRCDSDIRVDLCQKVYLYV